MKTLFLIFISFILAGCAPKKTDGPVLDPIAYNLEIETWHQKRIENLKGPDGWLNLAGLFWLNEGINTFGSDSKNNVVFPAGKIPERAGFFFLKQNTVTLEADPAVKIMCNGLPLKTMVVFHPDSSKALVQEYGSLQWFIIKRDNKFAVRLRDFKNAAIENFTTIERYPVDATWRLEASFEKADSTRTIDITNILGQTSPMSSPGSLVFAINGKEYRLDAIDEKEGIEDLFIIFGDATNTRETYGAGRYLYVKKPGLDGKTILDFNKAYNPPCAFTAFATCPLPPKKNILNVEVTAGEKNYGNH